MTEDILYLAFENPNARAEATSEVLACAQCRNKTYLIGVEGDVKKIYCASCRTYIGAMGWMPIEEDNQ